MRKNGLKQRLFHIFLATAIAVSSITVIPGTTVEVQAEKGEGTVYAKRTFDDSYDAQYAYSGDDLGCTYTKEKTTFKVWSPLAEKVVLCRYEKGNGGSVIEEVEMSKGDKGVWSVTIQGDIVNTYYTYKVTTYGETKEAVDIYAKAAGVNGDRAMVVDLDSTDPENWDTNYQREKTLLSDIIVWEVHIRDFSIDVSSGVSEENRGKYKAFTEDTTVNGEGKVASCVNYLKELGVTHVQLLPMYDYASVDETNVTTSLGSNYNWGYDPENYNVPEGSYSSNPYDGNVRITEMKEMIQALHDAGIKVVMDVVYNHTYDTEDSNFNKIMPDYYYKVGTDTNSLEYNNQSGCGNATRSESAMYRKFMIDSLTYWAEEYNLDGFRFDLMGIHDYTTMNQIRSTLDAKFGEDTIVLYGEGWTATDYDSNSAHKANEAKLDDGIGYFNDQIRDALKGEHKFDGTIGLVQYNYADGSLLEVGEKWPNNIYGGIMGSVGYTDGQWGMWRPFWSKSSNCSLSYVSAHDNLTLWDKLTEKFGQNYSSTDEKLLKMNKMAGSIVLSSKGGVFMQAGEEFARTKEGDENSYASSDKVNRIDWNRVNTYSSIQQYYEGMIKIRKAFSGFRSITTRSGDNWNPTNNNLTWMYDVAGKYPTSWFGYYVTNNVAGEWSRVAVIVNNATTNQDVTLDESSWVIIGDGTTAGLEKIKETGSTVTVPAKSVVVAVPKATFESCNITDNKAPVITTDSIYETSVGTALSFQIKTSDADGDTVTLSASGVPSGAVLDTATGNFTWDSPVAGTYTIELTATDGKASATESVVIIVREKTEELKNYVSAIENEHLQSTDYTSQVWEDFENALSNAREILSNNETDETKINKALEELQNTCGVVLKQKHAKAALILESENAESKLRKVKEDATNYDAEAIADLETVLAEVEVFLSSPAEVEEYESICEDLQAASDAVVSKNANPVIRVKASDWSSPAIWVWNDTTEENYTASGAWPGDKLTTKDSEGWYVYELPEGTTGYSLIINDGASGTSTQTVDITGIKESVDITVTSFSGKTCTYTKEEKSVGGGTVKVSKELLEKVLTQAAAIKENQQTYTEESYEVFATAYETAQATNSATDATQVTVNQTVRALKKAMSGLQTAGDITITPTVTPTEEPSETPTPTVEPTPTEEPSETPTPTVTIEPTTVITDVPTPTSEPVVGKVVVHFKSSEDNVALFYQNKSDSANKNVWQEAAMISGANGWFTYTIDNCQRAKLYCVAAGTETDQYTIEEGEWWYADDSWNSTNPDEYVTATPTPVVTEEPTPIPTVTDIPTATPTQAVTPTDGGKVTDTPTVTVTSVPTVTVVPTDTPTTVPATPTTVPTVTIVPIVTATTVPTVTNTPTKEPTQEPTQVPTATVTAIPTVTNVPTATKAPTTEPTVVVTKAPTQAITPTKTPTKTITPTKTPTKAPTNTPTPIQKKQVSLKVKSQNTTEAKLTWSKVSGTKIYKVYRATSKNGKYKVVGTLLGSNEKSYVDTDLTCGKTYYYYVQAYAKPANKLVCVGETKKVKVKVKPAKAAISSVKATEGKQAAITWKKLKNVTGYEVYFSTSKTGKYKKIATVKGASKKTYIAAMEQSGKYYFKVRAYKKVKSKKIYGSYSSVKSVTIE